MLEIFQQLNRLGYSLEPFRESDEKALYQIFRDVVDTGSEFPYESNSSQEFHRQFLNPLGKVFVLRSANQEVIGGFFIRPNFSGRSDHIANAAYMIRLKSRGQGLGTLLVQASLYLAKEFGFKIMQFNMVFSQNIIAVHLYRKLGFSIAGILPKAIRNPDRSYQDGYVMYKNLE